MYDLPSMDSVSKVVVDESVITGESKPYMVFEATEQRAVSD
jgi:ATP-dependent Clp protease ATP-binding subunit ClpX